VWFPCREQAAKKKHYYGSITVLLRFHYGSGPFYYGSKPFCYGSEPFYYASDGSVATVACGDIFSQNPRESKNALIQYLQEFSAFVTETEICLGL